MPGAALPRDVTFDSGGLTIHYLDWGETGKPGLVFIHGFGDHAHSWDRIAPVFRAAYHVVAVDIRGHGDSDHVGGGGYDWLDYIVDIANLFEHLGWSDATLVGHSMGGMVAGVFAGVCPERVRRMVLVEGWGQPERSDHPADRIADWVRQRRLRQSRPPREFRSVDELVARLRERNHQASDTWVRRMAEYGARQLPNGNYIWKRDGLRRVRTRGFFIQAADIYPLWERITCPVLHIRGAHTDFEPPNLSERLTHFHDARLVTVEGAGHMVHHDNPEGLTRELRAFLL